MGDNLIIFLLILAILAAILHSDFVLTLIYLLLGLYGIGTWWSRRALSAVALKREYPDRIFLGEKVPVKLTIANHGRLPVVWLQVQESLPPELMLGDPFRMVTSLGPKGVRDYTYPIEGRKRGYYTLGPVLFHSGDVLGLADNLSRRGEESHLTVYPKIVPLTRVAIPSSSPMGTLRHTQPVFEDPSRVFGKRDYVAGDSLRRVDWKASASSGRLQVKLFEPSIALETAIFLNLNVAEYDQRWRFSAPELGIVAAASLANWVTGKRQSVGLATNGLDPLSPGEPAGAIPPKPGRGNLMRILDLLARVQAVEAIPMVELVRQQSVHLPWGATMIVISPNLDEALFDALFQARRDGLNVVLVPCGPLSDAASARQRAAYFGFPLYHLLEEKDMDIWRQ